MKGMFVLSFLSLLFILLLIFDRKGWLIHAPKNVWDVVSRVGIGLLCAALCALTFALGFAEVHP